MHGRHGTIQACLQEPAAGRSYVHCICVRSFRIFHPSLWSYILHSVHLLVVLGKHLFASFKHLREKSPFFFFFTIFAATHHV